MSFFLYRISIQLIKLWYIFDLLILESKKNIKISDKSMLIY